MPHLPVKANPTAAAVALLLPVPLIPAGADTVPDMMGDVPTALIITGVALHHQEAMIATAEAPLEVVVADPLPLPPVETVMDRHRMVAALAPLLMTATVAAVVVAATALILHQEAHTAAVQITTVDTVDLLPSPRARAVATLQDPPAVETTPVDPPPILLR